MRYAVIMAGGPGERLWPLSTAARPKPFLSLIGERTMLQKTVDRIASWIPLENTYVVVGAEHRRLVLEQLPDLPPQNVIVEPMGRGTAACVGLVAVRLAQRDPEGVMIVLPADHVIRDEAHFLRLLKKADAIAATGTHLVTLGVTPDCPATGYGYIQASALWPGGGSRGDIEALEVERFAEKPDKETAQRFLDEGGYYWNSGMFIWRVDTILQEIETYMDGLYRGLLEIRDSSGTVNEPSVLERVYRGQEKIPIDIGVMEKSDRVLVLPTGDIGWNDVGDWAALTEILAADREGNVIKARHIGIDTSRSLVVSAKGEERLVATLGVSNLVIVDTEDVLLVMDKSRAQEVRRLIEKEADEGKGSAS